MHNDLFTVFGLTVHGYGLMVGLGVVAALLLSWRRARERSLSEDTVTALVLTALLSGFIGSKILYSLTHLDALLADPLSVLGSEGWVVYGGLLGGIFGVWLYCRRKKLRFLQWGDLLLPGVAAAQCLGRIGCFLAGCCYGRPTQSWLGVVFPAGSFAPAGVPLLPTQLFSAAGNLALCLILLRADKKDHPDGFILALYLLLYSVGRFAIEFLRDDYRGSVGALSTSQFIAVFTAAASLVLMALLRKKPTNGETP
ncbi:MAG: prolipoprotein diacylglyceryl transferase [Oscillospiraceae bacterium]|nr:prolipoprotein diacylglyceryl transferase [Oscillospiraceae bacterium]